MPRLQVICGQLEELLDRASGWRAAQRPERGAGRRAERRQVEPCWNQLAGEDRAIVTEIAGTTRDALRETIQIEGIPLHIIDTAGLRDTLDTVERIGIERTWREIERADVILFAWWMRRR